jgi:HSP20 family protein
MNMTEFGSGRHHLMVSSAGFRARHNEEIDPLVILHHRVNRVFDDMLRGAFHHSGVIPLGLDEGTGWPEIEVAKTEKEIKVTVELPGLDEKDVRVVLSNNTLIIEGEKESLAEDKNRWYSERRYGHFERRIPLDWKVEEDKASAMFRNGVLTVILAKSGKAQEHTKRIRVGNGS